MELYLSAAALVFAVVLGVVVVQNLKLKEGIRQYEERCVTLRKKVKQLQDRFARILDVDKEVETVTSQKKELETLLSALRSSYKEKKAIFDGLVKEAAIYDEEIQLAELGFYKPHFEFDASQDYKDQIADVRGSQKQMVSGKTAIVCDEEWTVEGSRARGQTMTNRNIRLTARAFNNECDAAVSSVSWNNAQRMEQRIGKAFDAINKLNQTNRIRIDQAYRDLKIKELQLTYEYRQKRQEEKEEQAEVRRRMREEAKLLQESDKAINDEKKYEQLLERAKQEAAGATAENLESLQAKIAALTGDLKSAHEKSERAMSMAQKTKSGHIYIVSNIGSFGDDVYKIGMTRRLDPVDRVKELGDASVPFRFDIHAIIYAEDAPAVESALHNSFEAKRVNLVNNRKEFFHVSVGDVRDEVRKLFPGAEFTEVGEAQEYRETLAIRAQLANARATVTEQYPDEI